MTTVLDLITASMQDLGAIAIDEVPTGAEASSALRALNSMISQWNTESLMVYNTEPQVFSVVPGQQSYTMGTGGNFNVARPVEIPAAYNRDVNGYDYPIRVTTNFQEYADIQAKPIETSLISIIYVDGGFPLQTLWMWPIPQNTSYTLVLWTWKAITSFSSLATTISLPPGYDRALQKNLAIEISPAYGRQPSSILLAHAVESKAQIKRINTEINTMQFPSGIPQDGMGYSLQDFYAGV